MKHSPPDRAPESAGFTDSPSPSPAPTADAPTTATGSCGASTGSAPPVRHAPLWVLAMAVLSGTLAMHMFVPALPMAAQELNASAGALQMTISVYIFGLAIGQPIYGPLADRFGRKPVLMLGLLLYTVAGIVSGLARDVDTLLIARLLQALGGCSGIVLGRTMVRDTSASQEATRRLALMNLMVTLGPILAPAIGGLVSISWGWRAVFIVLTVLGTVSMLFGWRLLHETLNNADKPASVRELAGHHVRLMTSRAFMGFALAGGCSTTAMYAFLSSAPFIFTAQLNRPAHEVGWYLALLTSGVWLGSMATSRFVSVVRAETLILTANCAGVTASFVLLLAAATDHLSIAIAVGCLFVFSMGAGVASPVALMLAMSVNNRAIGTASGLYGSIQMAIGAICTALAGLGHGTALAAASVMAGAGIVSQTSLWIGLRARAAATAAAREPTRRAD